MSSAVHMQEICVAATAAIHVQFGECRSHGFDGLGMQPQESDEVSSNAAVSCTSSDEHNQGP
jgi:hypothetical protein